MTLGKVSRDRLDSLGSISTGPRAPGTVVGSLVFDESGRDWRAFVTISAVLWSQQIGVLVVKLLLGSGVSNEGALVDRISSLLSWILVIVAAWILFDSLLGKRPVRVYWLLLAPGIYMALREITAGGSAVTAVAFVLVASAVAQLRVDTSRAIRLLGWLVAATAIFCLLVAVAIPRTGLHTAAASRFLSADKSLIAGTGLLRGVFSSSNNAGNFFALGLPFTALIRPRWVSIAAMSTICAAVVWTSSRSSIAAVVVVLVVVGLDKLLRGWRYLALLFLGVAMAWALPFVTTAEEAFSERGMIWLAIRDLLRPAQWVAGTGVNWFGVVAEDSATYISSSAVQAHNQALHLVVTGGFVVLALTFIFLADLGVKASKLNEEGGVCMRAWLLALVVIGSLEVPLGYADRVLFWPVVLLPAALLSRSKANGRATLVSTSTGPTAYSGGSFGRERNR